MESVFNRKPYITPETEIESLVYSNIEDESDFTYIGSVVTKDDPERLGRIKVASELFGIPTKFLPWVYPSKSILAGSFDPPNENDTVEVLVRDGDINSQFYKSIVPDFTNANLGIPSDVLPESEYLNSKILFVTDSGSFAKIVYGPNGDVVEFNHSKGTIIQIDENGSVNIKTGNELNIEAKSINIDVEEDFSLTVGGVININGGTTNINTDLVSAGTINLGTNPVKNLAVNIPVDYVTGAPMSIGNSNVYL